MVNFSFFSITGRGIDLDYYAIEWFALEMNRDHFVFFEIASKYCKLPTIALVSRASKVMLKILQTRL